jgi:hypothetical protein
MTQTKQHTRKPCPIATSPTTNIKWTVRVSNPDCRAVMSATNRLRHGTALNSDINLSYKVRFCSELQRQRNMRTLESLIG